VDLVRVALPLLRDAALRAVSQYLRDRHARDTEFFERLPNDGEHFRPDDSFDLLHGMRSLSEPLAPAATAASIASQFVLRGAVSQPPGSTLLVDRSRQRLPASTGSAGAFPFEGTSFGCVALINSGYTGMPRFRTNSGYADAPCSCRSRPSRSPASDTRSVR